MMVRYKRKAFEFYWFALVILITAALFYLLEENFPSEKMSLKGKMDRLLIVIV